MAVQIGTDNKVKSNIMLFVSFELWKKLLWRMEKHKIANSILLSIYSLYSILCSYKQCIQTYKYVDNLVCRMQAHRLNTIQCFPYIIPFCEFIRFVDSIQHTSSITHTMSRMDGHTYTFRLKSFFCLCAASFYSI